MMSRLEELVKLGLSAAVYTQTTDVEGEVNGFMTYDRKVIKHYLIYNLTFLILGLPYLFFIIPGPIRLASFN